MTGQAAGDSDPSGPNPDEATDLPIPDWVPPAVAEAAAGTWRLAASGPNFRLLLKIVPGFVALRRLACDGRMRSVWNELQRRNQRDGTYKNPAWGRADLSSQSDQQEAMAWLFRIVAAHCNPSVTTRSVAEIESGYADLVQNVDILRSVARNVRYALPERGKKIEDQANALAEELKRHGLSALPGYVEKLIVGRHRSDPHVRGFVIMAADACTRYFGSPLYSTVATIANVALDRTDMTAARVRALVRARPDAGSGVKGTTGRAAKTRITPPKGGA